MAGTVIVHGLDQIQRDLAKSGPAVSAAMRAGLRESAEPTAHLAEQLSLTRIRRMHLSPQWAETRVGVTRHAVYIVPKQRGTRGGNDSRRRPNLVGLMMGRSFDPALAAGAGLVEARVTSLLNEVTR
jgi:hypothetical protein